MANMNLRRKLEEKRLMKMEVLRGYRHAERKLQNLRAERGMSKKSAKHMISKVLKKPMVLSMTADLILNILEPQCLSLECAFLCLLMLGVRRRCRSYVITAAQMYESGPTLVEKCSKECAVDASRFKVVPIVSFEMAEFRNCFSIVLKWIRSSVCDYRE